METPDQIWDDEAAWKNARYSSAYVNFLRATLLPFAAGTANVAQVRENLWRSPIVTAILSHQQPAGSWPLGGPPWFRIYPVPLLVLVEYGMGDRPEVRRGVEYLRSTIVGSRFPWPRHEPHDPKDYYIAHQGRCLQVMAKAGVGSDPRVQAVAQGLVDRQRRDGGWSIKPDWMYRPREEKTEPRPSCWICTLEVMRGLGKVIGLPADVMERILEYWKARLAPQDTSLILSCLEFCADQGLRADTLLVQHLLSLLESARSSVGRFPVLPEYFEVLSTHVRWRVGATVPGTVPQVSSGSGPVSTP